MTSHIELSKPAELVSVVPYLLGFHPEHSLVVVGMSGDEVRCTIRLDLPGDFTPARQAPSSTDPETTPSEGTPDIVGRETSCATPEISSSAVQKGRSGPSTSLQRLLKGQLGCPALPPPPILDLSREFTPHSTHSENQSDRPTTSIAEDISTSAPERPATQFCVADATFPPTTRVEPSLLTVAKRPELAPFLLQNHCDQCVLVGYGPADDVAQALSHATHTLVSSGLNVLDQLRVNQGRWWTHGCRREKCCPPEGTIIPESTAATLAFVAQGGTALPSRRDIVAQLDPVDEESLARVRSATASTLLHTINSDCDWADVIANDMAALDHWMTNSDLPPTSDIADLALGLGDSQIREMALEFINRDPLNGRLDLWIWITRHLDDEFIAPVAAIAGFCAYRQGNGVLAAAALERSLQAEPTFRLAQILLKLLNSGVPPATLGRLVNRTP